MSKPTLAVIFIAVLITLLMFGKGLSPSSDEFHTVTPEASSTTLEEQDGIDNTLPQIEF